MEHISVVLKDTAMIILADLIKRYMIILQSQGLLQ